MSISTEHVRLRKKTRFTSLLYTGARLGNPSTEDDVDATIPGLNNPPTEDNPDAAALGFDNLNTERSAETTTFSLRILAEIQNASYIRNEFKVRTYRFHTVFHYR
ncbi:hypothetical protein PUN28_011843 [Cardiocondyla obscurior]|uniref:Uncharacterized protein n=1 Tax=Cardiocondyla obscurior TaxID=286306 RepID=A0AAW2FH82_9HYME